MKTSLHPKAMAVIENYLNIEIDQWKVRCPYFINIKMRRFLKPVWVGKGFPNEIERVANEILKNNSSIKLKNLYDVEDFIKLSSLGVDCSGLVSNVLDIHFKHCLGKSLFNMIKQPSFIRKFIFLLRPRTNVSADLLTGKLNSQEVDVLDIMPGDMLRFGSGHVGLIHWIDRSGQRLKKVGYIESHTKPKFGVQEGEIEMLDQRLPLEYQKWSSKESKKRFQKVVRLKYLSPSGG